VFKGDVHDIPPPVSPGEAGIVTIVRPTCAKAEGGMWPVTRALAWIVLPWQGAILGARAENSALACAASPSACWSVQTA
jgi:hypothetical protein